MVNFFKKFMLTMLLILMVTLLAYSPTQAKEKTERLKDNGDQTALALNYHRIRNGGFIDYFLSIFSGGKELFTYSVDKQTFESQMKWLIAHNAHFLTHDEMIQCKKKGHFPKRSVWINFDDMDESIYRNAHPILKKYNIPATGFVITGQTGTENFHNLNLSPLSELKDMEKSGLWTFQSHTHRLHSLEKQKSKMLTVSANTLKNDLNNSNAFLDQHFHRQEKSIAYPYGHIDEDAITVIQNSGISYGFILEEEAMSVNDDNYRIPRILVSKDAFNQLVKKWGAFNNEN
ncbi:intercellular adhesin biosynthesis polysaccharide N-deacetylase [Staphylococcus coagulans]|uniref:intercellular adhesin biosynthesis polysaccharide N-deacetylase n=2 Tax=Staphylococcus coagulans TaxID=74706 RepID=UPI001BEAD228|nr:intercellular adhesin biosynthesis polysaccharide N-deacetylase [Staphylococcus coagulans]MBT2815218.1 intercellular adhesin biosynthesis polysaccharide N-deacetylase [Staphylococcus coagulans]MBT2817482.1 intercellular adhesin biosynthesis polysaccharide N-deacetylase [Staphylococcus coagulans]MBT2838206.1 intercellular adhesin biosynthesis polysaccharide N-deacetylase [Staphylococcus coagulans]MBT2842818.1 intercellular adhesin biosynthesis polysaccharide N-deacetylase [Staphylococcus coag